MAERIPLRVAILGGGGLRTPLLAPALAERAGVTELALFDTDRPRLERIAGVARAAAPKLAVTLSATAAEAVRGSRFVIAAIRSGGQAARGADERICLEAGALGQETVGAAGAALAFRNIPAMVELARIVERDAPEACLVNYTNPVGMVTDALRRETGVEVIGICDTPAELAERAASLLYLDPEAMVPGWSGVNHCGWLTGLFDREHDPDDPFPPVDHLPDLFRDPDRPRRLHRGELFPVEAMVPAIPSEYVFFHRSPDAARERMLGAEATRGEAILAMEARLFARLDSVGASPEERLDAYRSVLAERDATYMQVEGGDGGSDHRAPPGPGGYDRIGLEVIRARLGVEPRVIVVNAPNLTPAGGPAIPELPVADIVEAPAVVDAGGARPLPQRPLPHDAARLLRRVRTAEREIAGAALSGDVEAAAEALREHPAGGPAAAEAFPRLRLDA